MTMVLLAAESLLHQTNAFPKPGSAAQELEKLLFEKVARATEEESKVVNGKIDKMKDYPTSASSNKGSNDIDFDEVLRQKSSAEIDDIKGHSEDKDKDSEPVILLETLPGASKQFQDTFSFLKAAYSSTTESPHAPNQLKKPRVSSLTLPSGTIHKGSPQNCWVFGPPPSPCLHFALISSTISTQPPCLLLGQPPTPPLVQTSFMNGQKEITPANWTTKVAHRLSL